MSRVGGERFIEGAHQEIAKMLGTVPEEDSRGLHIIGFDKLGRRVTLRERWVTKAVRVCEVVIRDQVTGKLKGSADLINGEFEAMPGGGLRIVDVKRDSFTLSPDLPAAIHHSQPAIRY